MYIAKWIARKILKYEISALNNEIETLNANLHILKKEHIFLQDKNFELSNLLNRKYITFTSIKKELPYNTCSEAEVQRIIKSCTFNVVEDITSIFRRCIKTRFLGPSPEDHPHTVIIEGILVLQYDEDGNIIQANGIKV